MPNAISKPNPHANVYCNSSMCDHANAARWIGLQLDLLMSALPALLEELHCLAEVLLKGRAQDCALLCQLALKARSLIRSSLSECALCSANSSLLLNFVCLMRP